MQISGEYRLDKEMKHTRIWNDPFNKQSCSLNLYQANLSYFAEQLWQPSSDIFGPYSNLVDQRYVLNCSCPMILIFKGVSSNVL